MENFQRLWTDGGERRGARKLRTEVYSESIKARMIARMTGPNALSATALSRDVGIPQATLSRWLLRAANVGGVGSKKRRAATTTEGSGRRAQDWTMLEKLQAVIEASKLPEHELGAFLRAKGLHLEQLEQWRLAAADALGEKPTKRSRAKLGPTPEQKRIRELERQLRHKEKALAEAAALLVLKKKYESLFGDEDDDTDPKSDG